MHHNGTWWNKRRSTEAYPVSQIDQFTPVQGTTHSFACDPKPEPKCHFNCKKICLHFLHFQTADFHLRMWSSCTPKHWIFSHVVRYDFARVHVTEVKFPTFLCQMRTQEPSKNTYLCFQNLKQNSLVICSDKPWGHCKLAAAHLFCPGTSRQHSWIWTVLHRTV